jgi:hypothetical protein
MKELKLKSIGAIVRGTIIYAQLKSGGVDPNDLGVEADDCLKDEQWVRRIGLIDAYKLSKFLENLEQSRSINFNIKLTEICENAKAVIVYKVKQKGTISKFSPEKTVFVTDEKKFKLNNSRWLSEIGSETILDNMGYSYSYSRLSIKELMDLADWIQNV